MGEDMRYLLIALLIATVAEGSRVGVYRAWESAQLRRAVTLTWEEAGLNEGLVSYWAMRRSGTTVFDEFGSNDGTAVNSPTFSEANGVRDDGVGLNGTSQFVATPYNPNNVTNTTISSWFYPTKTDASVWGATVAGNAFELYYSTAESLIFLRTSVASLSFSTASDPILNKWNHVVVVLTANTRKMYLNGNMVADDSGVRQLNVGTTIRIGQRGLNTRYFGGSIDEVAIWSRALSSNEVFQIYSTPLYAPYRED
jgi:hypothetical protein